MPILVKKPNIIIMAVKILYTKGIRSKLSSSFKRGLAFSDSIVFSDFKDKNYVLAFAGIAGVSIKHAGTIFANLNAHVDNCKSFSMKRKINLNNCGDIALIALINCASSSRNIRIVVPGAYLKIPG